MVNECLLDKRFNHPKYHAQFKLVQVNTNKYCYMLGPKNKNIKKQKKKKQLAASWSEGFGVKAVSNLSENPSSYTHISQLTAL